jgi:iron complex transport system ATP-binding protein
MIKLHNVTAGYDRNDVLKGITLSIEQGDFTAILGPNGAGKSTLLYTIIGYLTLRSGDIFIRNKPQASWHKKELARVIALIPQETVLPFDYTVEEMVLMGRYPCLNNVR